MWPFPPPQPWLIGKSPVSGAGVAEAHPDELAREAGEEGGGGSNREGRRAGGISHGSFRIRCEVEEEKENQKRRVEGEERRRGARSIIETNSSTVTYTGVVPAPTSSSMAARPPLHLECHDLGLNTVDPWHLQSRKGEGDRKRQARGRGKEKRHGKMTW